jgi:hypothetical protein
VTATLAGRAQAFERHVPLIAEGELKHSGVILRRAGCDSDAPTRRYIDEWHTELILEHLPNR